VLGYTQTNL